MWQSVSAEERAQIESDAVVQQALRLFNGVITKADQCTAPDSTYNESDVDEPKPDKGVE